MLASRWVEQMLGSGCDIRMLAGDASFRRYFRVWQDDVSYVLMDAPPGKEDVTPFLTVRSWLEDAGVRVPGLLHQEREMGFLLLEDFGDETWAQHLISGAARDLPLDRMFDDAFVQLIRLQGSAPPRSLPAFDVARMQRECDLYLDWYLPSVAGYHPKDDERAMFHEAMLPLLEEIASLPQVPVHLDFHSRNLMLPRGELPLGMIDFQDAVIGPVTYDPASLLYDCYQDYPETVRREYSKRFYGMLADEQKAAFEDFDGWHRALRLTAMQRHIKAIGIFGRLAHRDGKLQFLNEIPLTRKHLAEEVSELRIETRNLALLFREPETER